MRLGQHLTHSVEQECAGTAGRVEHCLLQRGGYHMVDDLLGQPVWRIVFTQPVTLIPVDKRFIDELHYIDGDVAQAEPANVLCEFIHQLRTARREQNPVEEVTLDCAEHSGRHERPSTQDFGGFLRLYAHDPGRNRFGDDHQEGVLEPEFVVLDFASID